MKEDEHAIIRTTTFQLSKHLHTQMRIMCVLTEKNMGEFIRMAISDKILQLKKEQDGPRNL
jgi:hypothetical protein